MSFTLYIYIYVFIKFKHCKTIVRAGTGKDVRLATTPKWAAHHHHHHHHHQHRTILTSCVEDPEGLDFVPRRSPGKFFFGFARGRVTRWIEGVYTQCTVSLNSLDIPWRFDHTIFLHLLSYSDPWPYVSVWWTAWIRKPILGLLCLGGQVDLWCLCIHPLGEGAHGKRRPTDFVVYLAL